MNKKTTRLSSIALALMMVLMVALTLVPIGAAGAAGATVDILVDEDGASDSKNVIVTDGKTYTLKVSEVIWADSIDKEVDSVRMTLRNWVDEEVSGYKDVIMTKSKTEDGIYTKSFDAIKATYPSTTPGATGLYTMELWRNFTDGTRDQTSIKVGAFWLAEESTDEGEWDEVTNASDKAKLGTVATTKIYVAPEAKIEYEEDSITFPTDGELRAINPVTKSGFVGTIAATGGKATYTLPASIAHETALEFKILSIERTAATKKCLIHKAANATHGSSADDAHKAIVDSKGPEIGAIAISATIKVVPDTKGILFDKVNTGATPAGTLTPAYEIEVEKIADDGVGYDISVAADTDASFANAANANDKFSATTAVATAASVGLIYKGTDAAKVTITSAEVTKLVNRQWKLTVTAKDALGNESKKVYDNTVICFDNYYPAKFIRVEAQNVLQMYVGQQLTLDEIEKRNITVSLNSDASFGDTWTWAIDAASNGIVNFDAATGTLTAVKPGTGKLLAMGLEVYTGDKGNEAREDYLSIEVSAEATVSSISLNNSALSVAPGASQKLTATTNPAGVAITWETGNSAVATVDAEGNVTGVANGTAVIYAKAGAQVATCVVTVSGGSVTVTGISLNKTAMSLTAGASETLFATTTPAGGAVSWNTSDASVATVDNAGKVTAQKAGTATITATSGSYSATCVVTVTGTPETLEPNQWYQDDAGNIYYSNEHSQLTVGWKKIGGYWYLFDYSTAVMKKGWAKDAGTWYYLQSDGKMKTGWLKDGSTWYYLQASGAMKTGWLKDGGVWYYLKDSGAMATGWVKVSGIWYYLQGSGAMKEGWLLESGVWYYLTPSSGAMLANGTYTVEGRKSQFAASGRWLGYV